MSRQRRAAHPIRVPSRNSAAVDVQFFGIDSKLIAAIENLNGERLVQFNEVDIADLKTEAFQKARHCENGSNSHFIRFATRNGKALEDAERLHAPLLRKL